MTMYTAVAALTLMTVTHVTTGQMTEDYRKAIVDEHNKQRRSIATQATYHLEYDMHLECAAQRHIERQQGGYAGGNSLRVQDYEACACETGITTSTGDNITVGENWYSGAPVDHVTGGATNAWVDYQWGTSDGYNGCSERENYVVNKLDERAIGLSPGISSLKINECQGGMDAGFIQVMWANTQRVGCYYTQGFGTVCNYYPAGNVVNEEYAIFGDSCAQCPATTKCVEGLCVIGDDDGNVGNSSQDTNLDFEDMNTGEEALDDEVEGPYVSNLHADDSNVISNQGSSSRYPSGRNQATSPDKNLDYEDMNSGEEEIYFEDANTGEEELDDEVEGPFASNLHADDGNVNSDQGASSGVPSGRSQVISQNINLDYEDMNSGEEKLDTEVEGPYVPRARVDEVNVNSDQGASSGVPSGRSQVISQNINLDYEDMNTGEEKLDREVEGPYVPRARIDEVTASSDQGTSSGVPSGRSQVISQNINRDYEDMNTGEEKLDTEIEGPYVPSARVDEVIANSDQGTSSGVPSGRSQAISHENNLEYEDMNNGEEKLDAESDARVNEFSVKSNQDSSSGFPGENVQDTSLSTNLDNEDMNSGEETLDGQFSGEPLAQDNENSSNFPGEARGSEDLPGEASDSNNYPDGTGGSETFPGEASGTDKYSGDNSGTDSFPGDASDAVEYSGDDSGTDSFPGDANDAEEYSGDDSGTDSFPGDDSDADDFPGDDVSPNIDEIIFPGADEIISINDDFDGNQIDFDGSIDDFNKLFTVQPDNGRANDNSSSDVNKPMNNNNDNSSGFIPTTYTIAGDIATFDQQAQDTFVQNLSGVLNVTPSRIIVVSVNAGSVVVATSLDDDAKAAMDNLSEEQMSQLTDLGIESYDVGNGEVTVSAADSNSDTSAESINDDGGNNMAVIIGGAVAGAAALLLGAGAVGAVLWRRRKAEDDKRKLKVQWGDVEAPLSFTVGKDMDMDMMFDDPLIMDDAHMLAASGSV